MKRIYGSPPPEGHAVTTVLLPIVVPFGGKPPVLDVPMLTATSNLLTTTQIQSLTDCVGPEFFCVSTMDRDNFMKPIVKSSKYPVQTRTFREMVYTTLSRPLMPMWLKAPGCTADERFIIKVNEDETASMLYRWTGNTWEMSNKLRRKIMFLTQTGRISTDTYGARSTHNVVSMLMRDAAEHAASRGSDEFVVPDEVKSRPTFEASMKALESVLTGYRYTTPTKRQSPISPEREAES